MNKIYITLTLLLCTAIPTLSAQKDKKDKNIETVVITATRTPKLLSDAPTITQVITSEDIKKLDVTDIQDLMTEMLPGVEFSYAMNHRTILNYQGFGGDKLLFLIDGNRVAGETMNNTDFARLNLDNVERIEIVKGAASSLYGSQAMGAVINIITKKPKKPITANVNGRWGKHNERRYGSIIGVSKKDFTLSTAAQFSGMDSYDLPINDYNLNDYTSVNGYKIRSLKQNFTYNINSRIELRGSAGYFHRTRMNTSSTHEHYYDHNASLGLKVNFTPQDILDVVGVYDDYKKTLEDVDNDTETHRYTNRQNSLRFLYTHTFTPNMLLTSGGDVMNDYLMTYQFEGKSHNQYAVDAFTQFDYTPTQYWNILGALRYDYFSATKANRITPKLSVMCKLPYFRLRSSYAAGFRSPTLKETYMTFNMANVFMIYGNENLKSESSHNIQFSGEYSRKNYNATLSYNRSWINNRITTIWNETLPGLKPQKNGGLQYTNIKRMRIGTVEANICARYKWGFASRLSYVYTHEYDESVEKGVKISATRPHTAIAHFEYSKDWKNYGFTIAMNGRYMSSVKTARYVESEKEGEPHVLESTKYKGYQMWNLNLTQRIIKGIHLTMRVNNLFNYTPSEYRNNAPATSGTTFTTGVALDLDNLF